MKKAVAVVERTLPGNLEAERAVLGSILVHNDAYHAVGPIISRDDFGRGAHGIIYAAITRLLDDERVSVDTLTLKEELARCGSLEEVGGPSYLSSLTDGVPRSTNAVYYAGIVKEHSTRRALIYAANKVLTQAYDGEEPTSVVLANADRAFMDLQRGATTGSLVSLRDRITSIITSIDYRVAHKGELRGLETGFKEINEITGGWMRGDLDVLAARPSIGKTAFVLNTAKATAAAGNRVAVFSLEMRRPQLEDRLLAMTSGVELTRIKNGYLTDGEYAKIAHGLEQIHMLPIHIDDRAGRSVHDIRAACRRLRADSGLDLVIIDYVQLMPGSLGPRANRNEQVTDISRRLKELADELSVPILLLSQLNRAASKRFDPTPKLEDLRESGALEQDADLVMFLHRKDHTKDGVTKAIFAKQRNGETGPLNLTFNKYIQTFVDGGEDEPEPAKEPTPPGRSRRRGPRPGWLPA